MLRFGQTDRPTDTSKTYPDLLMQVHKKGEMLTISISSFSHNVFKSILPKNFYLVYREIPLSEPN